MLTDPKGEPASLTENLCRILDCDDLAHEVAGVGVIAPAEERELNAAIAAVAAAVRARRRVRSTGLVAGPSAIRRYFTGDLLANLL
jgi:hypothetical protein